MNKLRYQEKVVIIMLGTSMYTKGGIATVARSYKESGLMKECGIKYISTHADGSRLLKLGVAVKAYAQFLLTLAGNSVKIVHVHSASRGSFYRKAGFIIISKIVQKKVIFHLHGGGFKKIFYDKASGPVRKMIISVIKLADIVIVLSCQWKEQMKDILGKEVNIKVIYNSVKEPVGITEKRIAGVPLVIFLGLVCEEKGLSELIHAAALVKEKVDIRLTVAGDGDLEMYQELVKKKGMENWVKFPGWVGSEEKDALLRETSVLVLPSFNEGLPMCILEALSYGVPVIATDVGGIPDIIVNGKNGFLVTPGDYKALADKLILLFDNESRYEEMSKEAIATSKGVFSMENTKLELKKIYTYLHNPGCE